MKDIVIVLNTCDAYEDVWELFFCAFNEYWPKCGYEIVLNTEIKQNPLPGENVRIHNFYSPTQKDMWGLRLRQTLRTCKSKYVLMLYDDFILEGPVDQEKITDCLKALEENPEVTAFYFTNIPINENIQDNRFADFDRMPQKGDYKLNSAPAIWRREKLLGFLEDNDNPWAWEFFGSCRTYDKSDLFYCVTKSGETIYPYNYAKGGAIYRGKWVGQIVVPLVKKYNLKLDLGLRGLSPELPSSSKRSLTWKVNFLLLGFKMIGFSALLPIFRVIGKKLKV